MKIFTKPMLRLLLTTGLILSSSVYGFEKVATTSFQFLEVSNDAAATGMGEAYTAVAQGVAGIWWNPAAITVTDGIGLRVDYTDWFLDTKHTAAAGVFRLPSFAGRIVYLGLHYLSADYGEIRETTVEQLGFRDGAYYPGYTGNILKPSAMQAGLTLAMEMTDHLAFGFGYRQAREDLIAASHTTWFFDLGLRYRTGFKSMILAAVVRNFGPEVTYVDEPYPLPQIMTIGTSVHVLGGEEPLLQGFSQHELTMAFDLLQPRDYDQQYDFGVEYGFNHMVFLRSGYRFNTDTAGLSFGAGLRVKGVQVDYSFNSHGDYLGEVHRFSIGFGR